MKKRGFINSRDIVPLLILIMLFVSIDLGNAQSISEYWSEDFRPNLINIRNPNGKFYAYIVLLFNENPHFINLIQEDSIPLEMIQKELFLVNQYKNYLRRIKNKKLQIMAEKMLDIYKHPQKYDDKTLKSIQIYLEGYNVILQFSKVGVSKKERIVLDYCIYGNKEPINIIHPLFNIKEKIYNIQPFIYYDEFNTSNSTFYFDMIYINPEEVQNDYTIAKMVLAGEQVDSMFFVGSRITEDIKHCIKNAFVKSISIKSDILKMFEIHELTHKILNNHYNYFDQVTGEELALLSTIYPNPFLGLSVLYSYMDYNAINPHKIAALNFIRFLAERTGKSEFIDNPSLVKYMDIPTIKKLSKEQFNSIIKNLR